MTGWLLDTLLYTGVLIALVLVLRRPVSHHFGPQLAYALWGLPFLRLLLPPVVLPASLAPEPVAAPMVDALPAASGLHWVEAAAATSDAPPAKLALVVVKAPAPSAPPAWEWSDLGEVALWLWLASAVVFLSWRVVMYRRMRAELLAAARPVGEIGKVRLVETPALNAPVAFGVLDKVIALPPLFMAQPDTLARDLAIQHELQHHRGHDLLANMAAQVLLALHWFNPLAWYGWRAMRRDQEAACDARVLAGRCRDERALYAALIVDIAAGPRLALAAPMACPVLGDKSVIHRLKSMAMSDITPGRRRLGRGLIVSAATLALPLTASISYSVARAQQPISEPVAAPTPPAVTIDPSAPEAPAAPAAPEAVPSDHREVQTFVVRREGPDGTPHEQHFTYQRHGPNAAPDVPMPAVPRMDFRAWGDPNDPDFEKRMEEWGEQMEKWGEEYGKQWEKWGQEQERQGLALAEQARRNAPEVVHSCDQAELARTQTEDGRRRVVICNEVRARNAAQAEARAQAQALSALRRSRNAIASNRGMDDEVRQEVLDDLDDEIERMERGED
ncbi:MAG TPA: M56 family metallopeptidase [Croceibacterium sp.]|nr:M56 family metallopeptidase [Croceibacterium sp.]